MSLPLCDHLTAVAARLAAASHVLLALDYDGTLTPLVDDPGQALLGPGVQDLLRMLMRRTHLSLAIISGRGLDDLRRMVGVDKAIYAGNHGLEIDGPGCRYLDTVALGKKHALGHLGKALSQALRPIAGAFVENKALTLSAHYRRVAPMQAMEVRRLVASALLKNPHGFHLTHGKDVLEIRPPTEWHKGTAVAWIRAQLARPGTLVLYVGDDQTDEDAFHSLPDAITVKVGVSNVTQAQYHVTSPATVVEFLRWFDRIIWRER